MPLIRPAFPALAAALLLAGCAGGGRVVPPAVAVAPAPGIATYLAQTANLSTLASAARAGGLARTLAGPGPFTVFAPTDAAFARLAPGAVERLLRPENRDTLGRLLGYHVVAGALTAADLAARIAAGHGTATLTSVEGDPLTLTLTQGYLTLTDADGNHSYVETGDVRQSNGVVHIVNGILIPRLN